MECGLPTNTDFESLQKEARRLLRALKSRDAAAAERYRTAEFLDSSFHARLADAQYMIARRYGFRSWASLKDRLTVAQAPLNGH